MVKIQTENKGTRIRSGIARGIVTGAIVLGGYYGLPAAIETGGEMLHARSIRKALEKGQHEKAVSLFEEYSSRKELGLDLKDIAELGPIIEQGRIAAEVDRKNRMAGGLAKAVETFDTKTADEIMRSIKADPKFAPEELKNLDRIAARLEDEPTLYNALMNSPEDRMGELTDEYVRRFPKGTHRDAIISQWLAFTYHDARERLAKGDPTQAIAIVSGVVRELEKPWPARPQRVEHHSARSSFRAVLDKVLAEPISPSADLRPGVQVRVVRIQDHRNDVLLNETYYIKRTKAAPVGAIGVIDGRVAYDPGSERVCVGFPEMKMDYSFRDYDCDDDTAPDIALFRRDEIRRAYLTRTEQSRLRMLADDLTAVEKAYGRFDPATKEE